MQSVRFAAILALLPLPGCVLPPRQPASLLYVKPGGPVVLDRGAISGRRQKVHFTTTVNPDCSPAGFNVVQVEPAARHGRVDLIDEEDFGFWSPPNPRAKCNERRLPGTTVFYTSEPGYHGQDEFGVVIVNAGGIRQALTFRVTVE